MDVKEAEPKGYGAFEPELGPEPDGKISLE